MDSEKTPLILSKVIPVFVYNLMYIQLGIMWWLRFLFSCGLIKELFNFPPLF